MITIQENSKPDINWNKRLINSGLGTIQQVSEMGKIFEKRGNFPRYFHFVDNKGEIVGQLLTETIDRFEKKGKMGKLLKKIPTLKNKINVWIYGPIIFDNSLSSELYNSLGKFFISEKSFVRGNTHPLRTGNAKILSDKFTVMNWSTSLIDLTKPLDELYQNIHKHSGQKNIQRAIKKGITVEQVNENSISDYNELINESKNESDSIELRRYWWHLLQPFGYSIFIAKKDGIPVGGLGFSYMNNFIIESGVARSKIDFDEKLNAQDLIKWKIIEWGVKNKMKYYNLAGFNPYPTSKKEEGIKRYKEKWGGDIVNYWLIRNF